MAEPSEGAPRPLEGVRVLDLTVALAGPYGSLMLAGLGAEVIKIEPPGGGDIASFNPPMYGPEGLHFGARRDGDLSLSTLARSRGKKALSLDLKSAEGREIFFRLVRQADVVMENLSEGVVERLGVDYAAVRAVNPRIVYCSLTGLGRPGLMPGVKSMDITIQALSGLMDTTGEADGPPLRVGVSITDLVTPLYAVIGIQAALRQRERTGEGQQVLVSMLECITSLLAFEHFDVTQRHGFPARSGNNNARLTPFGVYATADGYVSVAASSDVWTQGLFEAMGAPELIRDARFATRGARAVNSDVLNGLIDAWTRPRPSAEVVAALQARGVPAVQVRSALEALSDPAMFAAGALEKLRHPALGEIDAVAGGIPIHMSGSTVGLDRPAMPPGADTDAVLVSILGLDAQTLAQLRAKGAI